MVGRNERKHCNSRGFFFIAAAYLIAFSQPTAFVTLLFQSPAISAQGEPTAFVGNDYDVNIVASGISNLYAYQFDLGFNPNVLEFQGITFTNLLGNNDQKFCTNSSSWTIGQDTVANVACTRIISGGINGDGALATAKFRVVGVGESINTLSNVIASNPSAQQITVASQSSTLTSTSQDTTNQPPNISNVFISSSSGVPCNALKFAAGTTSIPSFTPGSDYLCMRVVVSDPNGNSEINLDSYQSYVAVWNPSNGATEGDAIAGHGWDHHHIKSFVDCTTLNPKTSLANTDTQICGQLAPATDLLSSNGIGVKDVTGNEWNVKVSLQDVPASSSPGSKLLVNSINVQTVAGIEISDSGCSFAGPPGGKVGLLCRNSGNEIITITQAGNVPMKVYTFMLKPFTSPSIVNGTNFYWNDARLLNPGTIDFSMGTRGQMYISIPQNLQPGNYTGGEMAFTGVAE